MKFKGILDKETSSPDATKIVQSLDNTQLVLAEDLQEGCVAYLEDGDSLGFVWQEVKSIEHCEAEDLIVIYTEKEGPFKEVYRSPREMVAVR